MPDSENPRESIGPEENTSDILAASEQILFEALERFDGGTISAETLLSFLPDEIPLNHASLPLYLLIEALAGSPLVTEVAKRLPNNIDPSTLSHYEAQIILSLSKHGQFNEIARRLPNPFPLFTIDTNSYLTFARVFDQTPDAAKYISDILPLNIDSAKLKEIALKFILSVVKHGQVDAVLTRLAPASLFDLNTQEDKIVTYALQHGYTPTMFKEALNFKESPRSDIDVSDIDTQQIPAHIYSTYIHHLKSNLREISRHGSWTKYELPKDDMLSNQSLLFVYINTQTDQIFFRGKRIQTESTKILQNIRADLSEYLPSNYYWELTNEKGGNIKEGGDGFREIFEGISLDQIEIEKLPKPIKESIILQRYYLIIKLREKGIDHQHPHRRNFNVRFLLKGKNGERMTEFDPKNAVEVAKKADMTLIPIVILRDWDLAKTI